MVLIPFLSKCVVDLCEGVNAAGTFGVFLFARGERRSRMKVFPKEDPLYGRKRRVDVEGATVVDVVGA